MNQKQSAFYMNVSLTTLSTNERQQERKHCNQLKSKLHLISQMQVPYQLQTM